MGGGKSKAAPPAENKKSSNLDDKPIEDLERITKERMATGKFRASAIRPSLREDMEKSDLAAMYEKMEQILQNEDELRDFSAFLMKQHAEEWVQFYLEVETYSARFDYIDQELASFADAVETNKKVATPEELEEKKQECERIYETFIRDGGELQLNLSAKAKRGVRKAMDEGHYEPRVFRLAMKCVIEQLTKERLNIFIDQQRNSRDVWLNQLKRMDSHRVSMRPSQNGVSVDDPKNVQSCIRLSKQIQKVVSEEIEEHRKSQQIAVAREAEEASTPACADT